MSTSERLDNALSKLRAAGHQVGGNGGSAVGPQGQLLILVDGALQPTETVYEMARAIDAGYLKK